MKWKQFLTPVKSLTSQEARAFVKKHPLGTFTLLDVRQPGEYEKARIPGAFLVPLPELPSRMDELDREKPLLVYCAVGGRSRAAAQMLAGAGFEKVYNLKGGIKAWEGARISGPAELGMDWITGAEDPAEVLLLAFRMEVGLEEFYREVSGATHDPHVRARLGQLADMEKGHQKALARAYQRLVPGGGIPQDPDAGGTGAMEGGFTTREFLDANRETLQSEEGVLSIAMMLEALALDLYTRYVRKAEDPATRETLLDLADQEKVHLERLGQLLESGIPPGPPATRK